MAEGIHIPYLQKVSSYSDSTIPFGIYGSQNLVTEPCECLHSTGSFVLE